MTLEVIFTSTKQTSFNFQSKDLLMTISWLILMNCQVVWPRALCVEMSFNIGSPGQINTTILSIFLISTFCGLSRTTTPPEFPHRRIDPLDPRSYPQGGSKFTQSQIYYIKLTLWPCIQFHLDFNFNSGGVVVLDKPQKVEII